MVKTLDISEDGIMSNDQSHEQICCATYKAGQIEVKASLLAQHAGMETEYGILLEHRDERAVCSLGSDLLRARQLFFDVVFGGVTACTLSDVIEDRMGTLF